MRFAGSLARFGLEMSEPTACRCYLVAAHAVHGPHAEQAHYAAAARLVDDPNGLPIGVTSEMFLGSSQTISAEAIDELNLIRGQMEKNQLEVVSKG